MNKREADSSINSQFSILNSQFLSDSHCHLYLLEDPAAALERALAAGVQRLLVPGTTLADSARAVALAREHDQIVAAVGIHPHEAKDFDPARDGEELERLAREPRVVAVGEIGLDFYYDHSPQEKQVEVLEWMLDLARRVSLPTILHNRESGERMLAILSAQPLRERPGVFHSFAESGDFGRKALDLGFLVSFSGMITFRTAENIRAAAAALPLDAMLLETDAPFLAPAPHRGQPNEPAFLVETAKKVASIKSASLETVAEATTRNFERLFLKTTPERS